MSLPTRRCGLKSQIQHSAVHFVLSPPTRRCGLKFQITGLGTVHRTSPPTRRCGLKCRNRIVSERNKVTSYAEVWIEIRKLRSSLGWWKVTSYAEVWIEMISKCYMGIRLGSPPTRRCGLKYPHGFVFPVSHASPPTRRCGLKSFIYKFLHRICLSPPTRR